MSAFGWSLPAGVSTLPGEESYYCPICGEADFTGVIDDSWPDGLPGQEEYCSINCAKAAQLVYKKEVKFDNDGNWNTTGYWVNESGDRVPFDVLINAGIDISSKICSITQEDIDLNGRTTSDCAVALAASRLFGVRMVVFYDSIVKDDGRLGYQKYKTGALLEEWLHARDRGDSVSPINVAFIDQDMLAEIV